MANLPPPDPEPQVDIRELGIDDALIALRDAINEGVANTIFIEVESNTSFGNDEVFRLMEEVELARGYVRHGPATNDWDPSSWRTQMRLIRPVGGEGAGGEGGEK